MKRVSSPKSQQSSSMPDANCANDQQFLVETFKNAKSILRKIEILEKNIQSFPEDQKLFEKWEQVHFREKQAQFAVLQDRCFVLSHFHNRILATSRLLRVSMSRAYQILKDEEEAFETGSDLTRAMLKTAWAERDQFAQAEIVKASEAALENQKQKRNRIRKKLKDKVGASLQAPTPLTGRPPWETPREEIKLTYRKLVRKLHPDYFPSNSRSSAKKEWMSQYWHRMQDAYQAKDQAALGKLYVMTVIHQQDVTAMTSAEIGEVTKWFQQELETLQAKAQDYKISRAWGFSRRKTYQALAKQITKELSRQMAPLSKQVQYLAFYHEMLEGGRPLEDLQKLAGSFARHRKRRPFVHANQTSFFAVSQ